MKIKYDRILDDERESDVPVPADPIQEAEWASWENLKTNDDLPKGSHIRITDPNGADLFTIFVEEVDQADKQGWGYKYGSILIYPLLSVESTNISGPNWNPGDIVLASSGGEGILKNVESYIKIKYDPIFAVPGGGPADGGIVVGNHITGGTTGFTGVITEVVDGINPYIIVDVDGGDPFVADGETDFTVDELGILTPVVTVVEIDYYMNVYVTSALPFVIGDSIGNNDTAETADSTDMSTHPISIGEILSGTASVATSEIAAYAGTGFEASLARIKNIAGTYQLNERLHTPSGGLALAGDVANASDDIEGWELMNYDWATNTASTYRSNMVFNEIPSGLIDSLNSVFATAAPYETGTLCLYRNGIRQIPVNDYTEIDATQFKFVIPPDAGPPADTLLIDYLKA